jgi:hypothetical protein
VGRDVKIEDNGDNAAQLNSAISTHPPIQLEAGSGVEPPPTKNVPHGPTRAAVEPQVSEPPRGGAGAVQWKERSVYAL